MVRIGHFHCSLKIKCILSCLTSSTRPNPPTPRVATTSRWSKGLDGENADTISFSWMTSEDSGWLWWRDTDFLDGDADAKRMKGTEFEVRQGQVCYVYQIFCLSSGRKLVLHSFLFIFLARASGTVPTWHVSSCRHDQVLPRSLGGTSAARWRFPLSDQMS